MPSESKQIYPKSRRRGSTTSEALSQSSFSSLSSLSSLSSRLCKSPLLKQETERNLIAAQEKFPKLSLRLFSAGYSLHHKISQYDLKEAFKNWTAAGSPDCLFKEAIALCEKCTGAIGLQALLNVPFNVELGPSTEIRINDPGDKFDPSFDDDGSMSPRSRAMQIALQSKHKKTPMFEKIGLAFIEAYKIHTRELQLSDSEMSTPVLTQWQPDESGRWSRVSI